MDLMALIILLVIIGVAMYAINKYVPMQEQIKNILNIIVIIAVLIFLLSLFTGYLPHIHVGK